MDLIYWPVLASLYQSTRISGAISKFNKSTPPPRIKLASFPLGNFLLENLKGYNKLYFMKENFESIKCLGYSPSRSNAP